MLYFVGDPGGARTHDPLIKRQRPYSASSTYSASSASSAPSYSVLMGVLMGCRNIGRVGGAR